MTSTLDPAPPSTSHPSLGWAFLVLALAWIAVVRVPLVLNARAHLDSDLAVDGLTLADAVNGHWRWHYPATPFIGSPPVLLSWLQAKVWGPTPITLVSGGVVAYGLIVVATYVLNRRAFGPSVAAWGLIPLAFASTGTVWLSGRVTGGHLLTVAWHAWAFVLFRDVLTRGGWRRAGMLGLWCGLGLYVDSMFAITWAALGVAFLIWAVLGGSAPRTVAGDPAIEKTVRGADPTVVKESPRFVRALVGLLVFAVGAGLGVVPRFVGKRADPHDAYVGQFEPVTRGDIVARNATILALDCLPRLVAGHRLPWLQAEPDPGALPGGSRVTPEKGIPWVGLPVTVVSLALFAWAMVALVADRHADAAGVAIRWGLLASIVVVVAAFLVYPSITNSDNYRYLVFLLVPWSSGLGLAVARFESKGRQGAWGAGALALGFAALMTIDSARWYERLGWVDSNWLPARKAFDDQALTWLDAHPEVSTILGDYWDVYRLSFLTGGRVRGVPFGEYPERFPEIKASLPGSRPRIVIVRPEGFGPRYRARALAEGGREVGRAEGLSIVEWPGGARP